MFCVDTREMMTGRSPLRTQARCPPVGSVRVVCLMACMIGVSGKIKYQQEQYKAPPAKPDVEVEHTKLMGKHLSGAAEFMSLTDRDSTHLHEINEKMFPEAFEEDFDDSDMSIHELELNPDHYNGVPNIWKPVEVMDPNKNLMKWNEDKETAMEEGIKHYNEMYNYEDPQAVVSRIMKKHKIHQSTAGFIGARTHILSGLRNPEMHKQAMSIGDLETQKYLDPAPQILALPEDLGRRRHHHRRQRRRKVSKKPSSTREAHMPVAVKIKRHTGGHVELGAADA